jgi:RHS repeat-associated protein
MRLAQESATGTEHFLTDALGSVRQMVDENGAPPLAQAYQPYGETLSCYGNGGSPYGFAGENTDGQTGLQYLRARYYAPGMGRFLTKDAWAGDAMRPMSYHGWVDGFGNPVRYTDPSGYTSLAPLAGFITGPDYAGNWKPDGSRNGDEDGNNRKTYYAPEWEQTEKDSINSALWDVAEAYANAYNAEMLRRYWEECGRDLELYTRPMKITPYNAFLKVHGGRVFFERTAQNALQYFSQAKGSLVESNLTPP